MGLFRKRTEPTGLIDLRERAPEPAGPPPLAWGAPAPCPKCGGPGYIDQIDLRNDVMHQHCVDCWHKYDITRAQVEASQA
jgi:Zn ribbon nucleic-acid-binding protein